MTLAQATGQELRQVREALTKAFTSRDKLARMLLDRLNQPLLFANGDLEHDTFNLLEDENGKGRVAQLLLAACAERPGSAVLVECARSLFSADQFELIEHVRRWSTKRIPAAKLFEYYTHAVAGDKSSQLQTLEANQSLVEYAWNARCRGVEQFNRFVSRMDAFGRDEMPLTPREESAEDELKLSALHNAMDKTEKVIKATKRPHITIHHLGLDMRRAWFHMVKMLEKVTNVDLEYHLLVITDQKKSLPTKAPPEVKRMTEKVGDSLEELERGLRQSSGIFNTNRMNLRVIVKQYKEIPVIHGWTILQPPRHWFVSYCRWLFKEPEWTYDWGGREYYHLSGSASSADGSMLTDIGVQFDSNFAHLWNRAEIHKQIIVPEPPVCLSGQRRSQRARARKAK